MKLSGNYPAARSCHYIYFCSHQAYPYSYLNFSRFLSSLRIISRWVLCYTHYVTAYVYDRPVYIPLKFSLSRTQINYYKMLWPSVVLHVVYVYDVQVSKRRKSVPRICRLSRSGIKEEEYCIYNIVGPIAKFHNARHGGISASTFVSRIGPKAKI